MFIEKYGEEISLSDTILLLFTHLW